MKKEKFNELAVQAGFEIATCMDGKKRLASPSDHDVVDSELQVFKNLLLDEVIKESSALIKWQTKFGSPADPLAYEYNSAIADFIEIIKVMK
jgi:hypothetical protein